MFFKRKHTPQTLSDEALIEAYKANNDSTYIGELFSRYTHVAFLVCMKYLKDEDDSQDAVMHVFEGLIESLKKHEVKQFKYWLHTVLKNHCLALIEKRKRLPTDRHEFWENETGDMEIRKQPYLIGENDDDELTETHLKHLDSAIQLLNQEQRVCIELFYLQNKSYQEVADDTGFDLKQVKSYIQNGKRNLKIHLSKMSSNE